MNTSFPYGIFIKEQIESQNSPISSLAPKVLTDEKDIEKIQTYLDSLEKTINQKGITNIALTGGYGSGKSTILKTFQNQKKKHKYLNISLASFNDITEEKGNQKAKKEELERLLEVSILQQIFYHVKPSEIPDSRFKRIINITDNQIFLIAFCLILWIVSILMLFKFSLINKINPSTWNINYFIDWTTLFSTIIFLSGIGLFAKNVIRLFGNSKINKVNIKGELELGDSLDKSVFNEHIEEIIYFFERTKYNVVVIEDLDRFESTDIFTKLREINILLNNSKLIDREINFIYAIKDEMFNESKERVKFFEYIIPVIPFINPSNAGDQLAKMIDEAGLKSVLSKDFTEDVVTFIDDIDMRLLINIFHEYQLYRNNLITDIDQDCLFAIITYKNLFPNDFGELQKRKGNLYKFLSRKAEYIKGLIENIEQEIELKDIEIKKILNERQNSIKELRAIYINTIHQKIPNAISLYFDKVVSFSEILEKDAFEKLKNCENIHYNSYSPNIHYTGLFNRNLDLESHISFSDIEKIVHPSFSFEKRKNFIDSKKNSTIDKLKKEIEKLKSDKIDIESWSLKQIFENIDINQYLECFSENELIRNLLLNGYLNENYNEYVSLFHEVNLTKNDYSFERKIKSGINSPFDYPLTKIENLVKKIGDKYFYRDSILNFDIVDFLAENHTQYEEKYASVLKLLSDEKPRSLEFIENYIEKRQQHMPLFINRLCKSWSGFWQYIVVESDFTTEKTSNYLKIIIKHADIDDIVNFKISYIDEYIQRLPDFLSLVNDNQDNEKIKNLIKSLNIKFEHLNEPTEETRELFEYVYENNHYQINIENIFLMADHATVDEIEENLLKANYTTILINGCTNLVNYIETNINNYVKDVVLKIPENISESEEFIIKLLNNQKLNEELKFDLIKKQNTIFYNLSEIEDNIIRENLIENNKVFPNWENVFTYYDQLENNKFNSILIDYLNFESNFTALSTEKIKKNETRSDDFIKIFSSRLIKCNGLNIDSYIKLIPNTTYTWRDIEIKTLDYEKAEFLLNDKKLTLSVDNFNRLKEYFGNLHIALAERNQDLFLTKFEDYILGQEDILLLLNSSKIITKSKIELIKKIDNSIIIENKDIGKTTCTILSNSSYVELHSDILESLFKHSNSIEDRIKLLNKHIDKLSDLEIQNLIEILGYNYKEIFKKQHKPKFNDTDFHQELFKKLKNKDLILRYELDKKDSSKIKVFANYQ